MRWARSARAVSAKRDQVVMVQCCPQCCSLCRLACQWIKWFDRHNLRVGCVLNTIKSCLNRAMPMLQHVRINAVNKVIGFNRQIKWMLIGRPRWMRLSFSVTRHIPIQSRPRRLTQCPYELGVLSKTCIVGHVHSIMWLLRSMFSQGHCHGFMEVRIRLN